MRVRKPEYLSAQAHCSPIYWGFVWFLGHDRRGPPIPGILWKANPKPKRQLLRLGEQRGHESRDDLKEFDASVPLRGPVAILFISRDTCNDSIAKIFRACFCGVSHNYRAICCKMGYRTDVPV